MGYNDHIALGTVVIIILESLLLKGSTFVLPVLQGGGSDVTGAPASLTKGQAGLNGWCHSEH